MSEDEMLKYVKAIFGKIEQHDAKLEVIREEIKKTNQDLRDRICDVEGSIDGGLESIKNLEIRMKILEDAGSQREEQRSTHGRESGGMTYVDTLKGSTHNGRESLRIDGGTSYSGYSGGSGVKVIQQVNESHRIKDEIMTKKMNIVSNASKKIGLFPIAIDNVRKFSSNKYGLDGECYNTEDNRDARIMAGDEFLAKELKFNPREIDISDARLATKDESKILWITSTKDNIKRIYKRIANVRNNSIRIILFTPKEMWKRKLSLEKNCKDARDKEPRLRTKIRYEKYNFDDMAYIVDRYKPDIMAISESNKGI